MKTEIKTLTLSTNQNFFNLHLEYSTAAAAQEKEYRSLEDRFLKATGYFPTRIEDSSFINLPNDQQDLSIAFWNNPQVAEARKVMTVSRSLAQAYFNAYADRTSK